MLFSLFPIIPTIVFYKVLNIKNIFYKIFLCILFCFFVELFCVISNNSIFNIYCTLSDKIGDNNLTDFIRYISFIFGYIFWGLFTVIFYVAYKINNKKVLYYLILFVLLVSTYFICSFISNSIYFILCDDYGYHNTYINLYNIFNKSLTLIILLSEIFYGIRKITQK